MANLGIIGLGQMGMLHSAILSAIPGNRVISIAEKDGRLTKIASKVIPGIRFYNDYHEMLEKEQLQGVYVCTPVSTHAPILLDLRSIIGSRAVFVEKPLATLGSESGPVVDAYQNSACVTMVGFQKRFIGSFRKAKELVDKGILGELAFFRSHFYSYENVAGGMAQKSEKRAVGATREFGVHLLDLILWFFGEPVSIESATRSIFSVQADDYSHSLVSFKGGLVGYMEICWSMRNYRPDELMIEIHGKNGALNVTEDRLILYLDKDSILPAGKHMLHTSSLTSSVPYLLGYPEYTLEDLHFLNCITSGKESETNFQTASKVNWLADKVMAL